MSTIEDRLRQDLAVVAQRVDPLPRPAAASLRAGIRLRRIRRARRATLAVSAACCLAAVVAVTDTLPVHHTTPEPARTPTVTTTAARPGAMPLVSNWVRTLPAGTFPAAHDRFTTGGACTTGRTVVWQGVRYRRPTGTERSCLRPVGLLGDRLLVEQRGRDGAGHRLGTLDLDGGASGFRLLSRGVGAVYVGPDRSRYAVVELAAGSGTGGKAGAEAEPGGGRPLRLAVRTASGTLLARLRLAENRMWPIGWNTAGIVLTECPPRDDEGDCRHLLWAGDSSRPRPIPGLPPNTKVIGMTSGSDRVVVEERTGSWPWVISLREPGRVLFRPPSNGSYELSPDGRSALYSVSGAIHLVDLDAGELTPLFRLLDDAANTTEVLYWTDGAVVFAVLQDVTDAGADVTLVRCALDTVRCERGGDPSP